MLGDAGKAETDLRNAIALTQANQTDSPAMACGDTLAGASLRLHIELGVMLQRHHRLEDALSVLGRALDLASAANNEEAIAAAHCWLGDVEWMREQDRSKNGIEVDDNTWKKYEALGKKYDVADKVKL